MLDRYGRTVNDLRLSLTDRCNLRCVYCMPPGATFAPRGDLLTDDELLVIVQAAAGLGVRKIRLTGGEPTLRPNLVQVVRRIATIPRIQDLAMTTNGIRLSEMAGLLAKAGLRRVNVSLDTLDERKFRRITRGGDVRDVLTGLDAAQAAGLAPIKLNAVVVRGFNEEDVVDLARFALVRGWSIRFIEVMPFGAVAGFQSRAYVPSSRTRARIEQALGRLAPVDITGRDPARTYRLPGARGTVGFISPVSQPFCAGCGRLRLTADGRLRLCLLRDDEIDLRSRLRAGATHQDIRDFISAAVFWKPRGHALARRIAPEQRNMSQIGG